MQLAAAADFLKNFPTLFAKSAKGMGRSCREFQGSRYVMNELSQW